MPPARACTAAVIASRITASSVSRSSRSSRSRAVSFRATPPVLLIAASAGLRRAISAGPGCRWAPRLLAIAGAGFIGGGIFHPDPSGGFPPGTPPGASAISSWHGVLHQVSGSAAFLALIVFCFVVARRYRATGQRATAVCSVAAGVLCAAGVATGGGPHGTLTLFIVVSIALLWASFTTAQLISSATRSAPSPTAAGQ